MRLLTTAAVLTSMFASVLYGEAIPYTNFEVDMRIEATATGATGVGDYTELPWVWYSGISDSPAPFWTANTTVVEEATFTGPPTLDPETLVGISSYVGTRTLKAHEEGDPDSIIGTMVWSVAGNGEVDFNTSRAIVDEDTGVIMIKIGQADGQPFATYTLLEETGVFLDDHIVPVSDPNNPDDPSDSRTFYSGWFVLPLLPGVDVDEPVLLQQNIFGAPVIHSFGEGVWNGHYTFSGPLQAGDADQDFDFDQFDLIHAQQAAKYLTGQPATWGEGDWNGAPGGSPDAPPAGDGLFNQDDIVAALNADSYLKGPFGALAGQGQGDGKASITYNPANGELGVEVGATELTSINIDSAAAIFTGEPAQNLSGSIDNDADDNIFKATFGGSFGTLSFGNVAQAGLGEEFVRNGLSAVGSLLGGGDLGAVDLRYVPEPSMVVLLGCSLMVLLATSRRRR